MPGKLIRYVGMLSLLWIFVIAYIGYNLFGLVTESKKSLTTFNRVQIVLDKLRRENNELRVKNLEINEDIFPKNRSPEDVDRNERDYIKNLKSPYDTIDELQNQLKDAKSNSSIVSETSQNYDVLRHRIANQIKEMWFYLSTQLTDIDKVVPRSSTELPGVLTHFAELQQITERDFDELIAMDGAKQIRDENAKRLSEIVQNRLTQLQNPTDCQYASKLVCSCNKPCGYGCQMHHVLYCLLLAYSANRTLIIESSYWSYSSLGWNGYFLPVSAKCVHSGRKSVRWNRKHERENTVRLSFIRSKTSGPIGKSLSVPRDLYDDIAKFHGQPFVWWAGQFSKYLYRYQPNMRKEIDDKKYRLGFLRPIVGIHVRRTDKLVEAALHNIEEYMYWVDLYFKKLALTESFDKKRVYLASDDPSVLPEAIKKYPDYKFLSDNNASKAAYLEDRYTEKSLLGIISDIEILSDTDFLVCTFSSQVCRMAYEIMNGKHTDASQHFHSLDDIYYFIGQEEHRMKAILPHKAKSEIEVDLEVGDEVVIAGNHWDGYAKVFHRSTNKTGLTPAFKLEDVRNIADVPI